MEFTLHDPPAALRACIKAVWSARGTREDFASPEPIVPDGCVEIVFNLADPFVDGNTGARQPRALLAGQMTRPVVALPTGAVDLIGVRFRTSRAGASFRVAMWQLQNSLVDAASINPAFPSLVDSLADMRAHDRLAYLSEQLTRLLFQTDDRNCSTIDHALNIIDRRRGNIAVESLARAVGVSRRHLERRFRDEVGLSVKQTARIARVHCVLRAIDNGPSMSGAELAATFGFSDQAHLIRECKALTGRTPSAITASDPSLSGLMRVAT